MRLEERITSENAALLVFSPDAIESRLVSSIERWICDRTGCTPIARQWFAHTDETIEAFYLNSIRQNLPHWHLVSGLFQLGPSLATLWSGPGAVNVLTQIKGCSHPAIADKGSIRGQFWCDNPVANLVHVSDNAEEALRELSILRSIAPTAFMGEMLSNGLQPFPDKGPVMQRHNGVLTLCSLATDVLGAEGRKFPRLNVPKDGDAHDTMTHAEAWLQHVRGATPHGFDAAIGSFLDGSGEASGVVNALGNVIPITRWDRLILRCGLVARKLWREGI